MMTPESLVARAMLDAVKRKVGIARKLEFSWSAGAPDYRVAYIEPKSEHAKYSVKPIFVSFGADIARAIISNTAPEDWASFCEVNPWQSRMV